MVPRRVLFLCSRNRLRSPTAEQVFGAWPGLEVDSAGLANDAEVMESSHRRRLQALHRARLKGKRVICLDIPDRYEYMQPELVSLLLERAGPLLR
jgi:predicted protein tyrosine phosphatase